MASFCITRPAADPSVGVEYYTLYEKWAPDFTSVCLCLSSSGMETLRIILRELRDKGVDAQITPAPSHVPL